MKFLALVSCLLVSLSTMDAQQDLTGIWNTGDSNTKVEITEDKGVFSGKIHSSDNAKVKIGTPILRDVTFKNGEGKGQLYAAKKEKWYDAVLKENGDKLEIKIKVGFAKKTIAWTKE